MLRDQVFVRMPCSFMRVKFECLSFWRNIFAGIGGSCGLMTGTVGWKSEALVSPVKSRKCPPVSRCVKCSVVALDILESSVLSFWSLKCTAWMWGANGWSEHQRTSRSKDHWFVDLQLVCNRNFFGHTMNTHGQNHEIVKVCEQLINACYSKEQHITT